MHKMMTTATQRTLAFVMGFLAVTQVLYDRLPPTRAGSWVNCGGTSIGYRSKGKAHMMGAHEIKFDHLDP